MSISLEEASKLSTDILLKGIIETIIKDSPILQELPFIQIVGNSLKYNQELTLPTVAWHAPVTGEWAASEPLFKQLSATLCILGGDADVDNFLKATRSNIQDLEAAVIEQKAKALRHEFENTFINGDSAVDTNQPDGLYKLLTEPKWEFSTEYKVGDYVYPAPSAATGDPYAKGFRYVCTTAGTSSGASQPTWPEVVGETVNDGSVVWTCEYGQLLTLGPLGTSLSLSDLDALIDLVKGGKPDMLLMSRRSRRKIQALARAAGSNLQVGEGKLGQQVQLYNGIPIAVNDWIKDNYQLGTNGDATCSVIFAFQMGEGAVCGLSSPEMIQVERLGSLETKDASRTRVKWYNSLALFGLPRAAVLTGVKD